MTATAGAHEITGNAVAKEKGKENLDSSMIEDNEGCGGEDGNNDDDDDEARSAEGRTSIKNNHQDNKRNANDHQLCYKCKSSLANSPQIINIAGQPLRHWHPHCFKCVICCEPMDMKQSCHVYKDQIVCRADFARLKRDNQQAVSCARCRWQILPSDWVRRASSHVYHIACFNCDICMRQLNTGEQFIISRETPDLEPRPGAESKESDGDEVVMGSDSSVRLLCRLHFTVDSKVTAVEAGRTNCNEPAFEKRFSLGAFAEVECHRMNLSSPNYSKLLSRFATAARDTGSPGPRSASDGTACPGSSASLLAANEHTSTSEPLQQHKQGANICATIIPSTSGHLSPSSVPTTPPNSAVTSATATKSSAAAATAVLVAGHYAGLSAPLTPTGCPRIGAQNQLPGSVAGGSSSASPSAASMGISCKSKRVRTTFTEDQLSILQTHFQRDSNPDGQDLERIATITGLSKRVTQVWFQNSRARQKKYLIKRKPGNGAGMSVSMVSGAAAAFNLQRAPTCDDQRDSVSPNSMAAFAAISAASAHFINTDESHADRNQNYCPQAHTSGLTLNSAANTMNAQFGQPPANDNAPRVWELGTPIRGNEGSSSVMNDIELSESDGAFNERDCAGADGSCEGEGHERQDSCMSFLSSSSGGQISGNDEAGEEEADD